MEINWVGGIVAGLLGFMLGGLWYSPVLFGKTWQRETGVTMGSPMRYPVAVPMVGSAVISVIGALALSWLVGPAPGLKYSLLIGAVVGILMVAPAIKMNGLFGQNSFALIAIQASYPALQYILFGLILGVWP